jgi:hypothetical protein
MIVDDKRAKTLVNGTITESFFTVKQENLAHVFSILRNSLYSDKAGAIIREYSTNAYDAHVQAGIKDQPIAVNCPTRFSPSLTIRDYGFGLSENDIYNVYASYGESTKRNTNDQVGMMGLGCKSAFCYTDSFTIVSHNDGMQKTYLAYIDDSGIGKVMKIEEKETTETGIEIIIPVQSRDCYMFENAILKQLQFFNPKPTFNLSFIANSIDESAFKVQIAGEGFDIISSYDNNFVVMGNVAYPFDSETFSKHPHYKDAMNNIVDHSTKIVLHANIGDVIPSASRESLDLREKTVNWVGESLIRISSEIAKSITDNIDSFETIWQARVYLGSLNGKYQKMVSNHSKDGILMMSIMTDSMDTNIKKIDTYNKFTSVNCIKCERNALIYASKGDISFASIKKRIFQDGRHSANRYVVECKNISEYSDFINHPQIIGANIIDLSTIELPKIVRNRGQNAGNDAYLFIGMHNTRTVDSWQKAKINFKHGSGFYIPISNYSASGLSDHAIYRMLQNLCEFGHDITLHGVRESDIDKLGDGWTNFKWYAQNFLDNLPQDKKDSVSIAYVHENIEKDTKFLYQTFANLENDPFNFKSVADLDKWTYEDTVVFRLINLFVNHDFRYDLSKEREIVKNLNSLKSKYPLIKYTEIHTGSIPFVIEYIEAMNK